MPGIRLALEKGAAVMVTSHLGRPTEGQFSEADSLAPIASAWPKRLGRDVPLVRDWLGGVDVKPGAVVLLENCRFNVGEKKNADELAQKMAALCDVYVNDAFGTAHRAEATTHGIAKFAKVACAGPLLAAELDALGKALANPRRPLVAIVAGSKVSTKLTDPEEPLRARRPPHRRRRHRQRLHARLGPADRQLALRARPPAEAKEILVMMEARGAKVPIPTDVVVAKAFAADAPATVKAAKEVEEDDMILDIGPATGEALRGHPRHGGHDRLERACRRVRVRRVRQRDEGSRRGHRGLQGVLDRRGRRHRSRRSRSTA